jgi:thioredoxin-like negative regulator of GroEL
MSAASREYCRTARVHVAQARAMMFFARAELWLARVAILQGRYESAVASLLAVKAVRKHAAEERALAREAFAAAFEGVHPRALS